MPRHIIAAPGTTSKRTRTYFHATPNAVYIASRARKLAALLASHGIA